MGTSWPCFIMTSLRGVADKNMTLVDVVYLKSSITNLMFLSLKHTTNTCEHVRELILGNYHMNQNKRNFSEFIVYYPSYSQDDSTIGDLKELKSLKTHQKLLITSILFIHMTFGASHDYHIQDSMFEISSIMVGLGIAWISHHLHNKFDPLRCILSVMTQAGLLMKYHLRKLLLNI